MPAVLNTNMASLYAQKSLSTAQADLAGSVQKLSSGKRINSAKDDAAGYAVAEAVKATKNITDQSIQNTQDAISLVQTAEGALDVVGKMLQRALTLITQKANGSLTGDQSDSIDAEILSLSDEIVNIRERTKFQGDEAVFDKDGTTFSTGSGAEFTLAIADLDMTFDGDNTVDEIQTLVQDNIVNRASLGAQLNTLNYIVDNLQTLSNNLADAQSRIVDTNYAAETANLTRGQILQQAATSMLAQANQMPNVILTLLK
jgi:flagellin